MPGTEFDELYQQLSKTKTEDKNLQDYLDSMKALDESMKQLCKLDRRGIPPKLDQDKLKALLRQYGETAQKAETYFKSVPENEAKQHPERELVKRLTGFINHDLQTLLDYRNTLEQNPKAELESLPTLIEKSRIPTIDLSDVKIKSKSGMMSKRLPMEVTLNGKVVQGMFTKESRLDFAPEVNELISKTAKKLKPELQRPVEKLLDCYRRYMENQSVETKEKYPINMNDTDFISFSNMMMDQRGPSEMVNYLRTVLSYAQVENPQKTAGKYKYMTLAEMVRDICDIRGRYLTHNVTNKIDRFSRLDDRNAAMSTVASLLGVSHVICKSVAMRYRDENGNMVNGTLMEMAKGIDPNNPQKMVNGVSPEALDNPKVIKDLANLQVLDYICGNTDRHAGNMIFNVEGGGFDENGDFVTPKITGVQGIDNDLSFGARNYKKGCHYLAAPENMRVIGEDMAKKIMALEPEQLRFALRQYSLNEKQLEFAALRLKNMQNHLQIGMDHYRGKPAPTSAKDCETGYIRVLSDDDFGKLKAADLVPDLPKAKEAAAREKKKETKKDPPGNIFTRAITNIKMIIQSMYLGRRGPEKLAEVANRNRATGKSAEAQNGAANSFASDLLKLDKKNKTPEAAEGLRNAILRYKEFQNNLNQRLNPQNNGDNPLYAYDRVIKPNDLENIKKELELLKKGAEQYQPTGNKDRYDKLAKEVLKYTNKMLNLTPEQLAEEKQTARDNERQATERFNTGLVNEVNKVEEKKAKEVNRDTNVKQQAIGPMPG